MFDWEKRTYKLPYFDPCVPLQEKFMVCTSNEDENYEKVRRRVRNSDLNEVESWLTNFIYLQLTGEIEITVVSKE